MAGFGEKFSKITSDTKKKTQIMVETNKLNSAIRREEAAIQTVYSEIGKNYFETYRDDEDAPEALRAMMDRILNHLSQIEGMRAKLIEIRGVKVCPGCGAEAQIEVLFCSKCGHGFPAPAAQTEPQSEPQAEPQSVPSAEPQAEPQPVPQATPQAVPQAEPQSASAGRFCQSCGQPLAEGMKFCGNCGNRQQ